MPSKNVLYNHVLSVVNHIVEKYCKENKKDVNQEQPKVQVEDTMLPIESTSGIIADINALDKLDINRCKAKINSDTIHFQKAGSTLSNLTFTDMQCIPEEKVNTKMHDEDSNSLTKH